MKRIDYLRISVTDRCNLKCIYCQPMKNIEYIPHCDILRFEEIERIVKILVQKGIRKVRLTGGEPLLKRDIVKLVSKISGIEGIEDLSLTTNGIMLLEMAGDLNRAGLNRVNISLDTLKQDRYYMLTGCDQLPLVLASIEEALKTGLKPLKINVVLIEGINDDEVVDFAEMTLAKPISVRFIEYSPTNQHLKKYEDRFVSNIVVKERIESKFHSIYQDTTSSINGPAVYYKIKGSLGNIGFISSNTNPFCSNCNRVRLTSEGKLLPCLYSSLNFDIKSYLRKGSSDREVLTAIDEIFDKKSFLDKSQAGMYNFDMSTIGG